MAECALCGLSSARISSALRLCLRCIRENPKEALPLALAAHGRIRDSFGLPVSPPREPGGVPCTLCVNACRILEGQIGFCGLRRNTGGELVGVSDREGKLSWYHDPLPTNCVADWVCPGSTGAGHPRYAHRQGPEKGYKNLAVFFHACSFDCLFCQNWHFRSETGDPRTLSAERLVESVDERTSCICYFGGDPAPQLPFSLYASRLAMQKRKGGILRLCWETGGSMSREQLDQMVELALQSGGCIKFDLKAWTEALHVALTGVSNRATLDNLRRAAQRIPERREPPLLVASTLLVPGYIDEKEVAGIARLLASLDPQIPYSLLAFHPCFEMEDLPFTDRDTAQACLEAAQAEGLRNVRLGNRHLLV